MEDVFSRDKIENLLRFQEKDFPELHQAAKDDNIILFLGAGLAKMYGCLLWSEMAKKLSEVLLKYKMISYAEEDILSKESEIDPRKVISICYSLCKNEREKLIIYEKTIKDTIKIKKGKSRKNLNEIYELIFSINPKVYLTTNLDLGIKSYSSLYINPNQRIYNCTSPYDKGVIKEISYQIFKDGNIVYLHGNYENIENSILTVDQYLEYYSDKENFLRNLFSNIDGFIVFIGYGLTEWDVIEKIYKIYKSNKESFKIEITGCLLSPVFTHEITKFKLEQSYYESFGVKSIPYLIDNEGYKTLKRVLENLKNALDKTRPTTYDVIKEIEEI
jgi:hypothetical protein